MTINWLNTGSVWFPILKNIMCDNVFILEIALSESIYKYPMIFTTRIVLDHIFSYKNHHYIFNCLGLSTGAIFADLFVRFYSCLL